MMLLLSILIYISLSDASSSESVSNQIIEKRQLKFIEGSTNIEYTYLSSYNDYYLYKLVPRSGSTLAQLLTVNRILEDYLQKSFESPERSYPHVAQMCGSSILAFFARNTTVSLNNINALLLARSEAENKSNYVCYLSVLKEHRQKGLGTKLLSELISQAIPSQSSQVTLHVNTKNSNALSLYLKCGMRCVSFIPNYYFGDRTYATQDAFLMALQLRNVKNSTQVCQSPAAISISSQEELWQKQICKIR